MLIVDTGPLVAAADRADRDHAACRALLEGDEGPLVTTGLVIAEAAYLITRQLGPAAEAALYSAIIDRGSLRLGRREVAVASRIWLGRGVALGTGRAGVAACARRQGSRLGA